MREEQKVYMRRSLMLMKDQRIEGPWSHWLLDISNSLGDKPKVIHPKKRRYFIYLQENGDVIQIAYM